MSTPDPVPTLEARVKALEAKVESDAKALWAKVWPHIVTWAGIVYALWKHVG